MYLLYLDVALQSTVNCIPTVSLNLEKFNIIFTKCYDGAYMLLRINISFSLQKTRLNRKIKKKGVLKEKIKNLILCSSINRKAIALCTEQFGLCPKH